MRKNLADKYIRGRGLEIGGLHYPLPVPAGARVIYVDRMSLEELKKTSDVLPVDNDIIVDDAERLVHFQCTSMDFLIANHVLEHCRDVLKTLRLWASVLVPGGIIYAAVPEKTQTFDRNRPVTPLSHHIVELASGPLMFDREHYREYLQNVDNLTGKELNQRVESCITSKANIHFHAWDRATQHEIMNYASLRMGLFDILEAVDHGAEIIWVLRKR